jgi:hypothetical protein
MSTIGFCHSRTILSVPSFEDFFRSETPARDKFLSRLFGLFSEDVVRHWSGCPEAQYQNLGRPYLRPVGETKGYTLDFTLRNRDAKTFVAELKCELEWDHYKYLRLTDASQLAHHTLAVNGAVLVWGATTPAGCEAVRSTYGFADVLSVEAMLDDLRRWHCESWSVRVAEVGTWCSELTEFLGGETPNGH